MRTSVFVDEITAEWLGENCPQIADALRAQGRDAVCTALRPIAEQNQRNLVALLESERASASTSARDAERARINAIRAHAAGTEGLDELVAAMVADSAVTPEAAAARILDAVRKQGSGALARLRATEPANPPPPSVGNESKDAVASAKEAVATAVKIGAIR